MITSELIAIFEDTQNRFRSNEALRAATNQLISSTKVYAEGYVSNNRNLKNESGQVCVVQDTTFSCASKYISEGRTVAVLNFANPYEPGGGAKRGVRAQEECLCRCSNLYNSISDSKVADDYYKYNKDMKTYLFSDRAIYSPGVTVIKDDEYAELSKPFRVDVITCAAPYNVYGHDVEVLKECYANRIRNILEIAMDNNVDVLVLGAFGCGVFRNPPLLMAECFKKALLNDKYAHHFDKVVFAIKKSSGFDRNFEAFQQVFG